MSHCLEPLAKRPLIVYQVPATPCPTAQCNKRQAMLQVTIPFLWNDEGPKAEAPLPSVPLSELLLPKSIPLLNAHLSPSGAGACVLQRGLHVLLKEQTAQPHAENAN